MEHRVDLLTVKDEFIAARQLLADGVDPQDIMVTHRGGQPSMRGSVGWWATHCVQEQPRLAFRRYSPPKTA